MDNQKILQKKEKRDKRRQFRENKKKLIQICNNGAFRNDCLPIVVNNSKVPDEKLRDFSLVCKGWNELMCKLYGKIKKVRIIVNCYDDRKYLLKGVSAHEHKIPDILGIEVYKYNCKIWTQQTLTNKMPLSMELLCVDCKCDNQFTIDNFDVFLNFIVCPKCKKGNLIKIDKSTTNVWT